MAPAVRLNGNRHTAGQHPNPPAGHLLPDFTENDLFVTRLHPGQPDIRVMVQFVEIAAERAGAIMTSDVGQLGALIGKGNFDNQRFQIGTGVKHWPQGPVRLGVSTDRKYTARGFYRIANRRHCMRHADRMEIAITHRNRVARIAFSITQDRLFGGRQLGKVRPDDPVKNMRLQRLDGFLPAIDR